DEIIVPSHTAFPSIEPMIHFGAKPVFVDIDDTYCIDVDLIEASITPRTVGILPVHLYGHPANLDRIFEIAKKHGLWVIEDCAQAHGAKFRDKRVGSMGVAGAFSFFPSKNLTVMGDGGCITTNDTALADDLRMLRNHGRKSKYIREAVGYNYRGNGIHDPVANHQQPAVKKLYSDLPSLPKTEAAVQEILSLPIYGELPLDDVDYVCDAIFEFFGKR